MKIMNLKLKLKLCNPKIDDAFVSITKLIHFCRYTVSLMLL